MKVLNFGSIARRRTRLWWLLGGGTAVALSLVLALLVVPKLGGVHNADQAENDSRPSSTRQSSQAQQVESLPYSVTVLTGAEVSFGKPSYGYAGVFPLGTLISKGSPRPEEDCKQWYLWGVEHGATDLGKSDVVVTIAAIRDPVRVHTGRVHIERLPSPPKGDVPRCIPSGGPMAESSLDINLDTGNTEYWYQADLSKMSGAQQEAEIRAGNLDSQGRLRQPLALDVTPLISDRINVIARSGRCYCRWYLELEIEVAGRHFTHRVDNHGQPFLIAPSEGSYDTYLYDRDQRKWCRDPGRDVSICP